MSIELALNRLGYTKEWLSLAIISEEYLLSQYAEINVSEDQNAEHYRCGAFGDYLRGKERLTTSEIDAIFSLSDNGPDNCDLMVDRIIQLIVTKILSDDQLEYISKYPEVHESPISKRYLREIIIRRIGKIGASLCLKEIKDAEDSVIHEHLVQHAELDYDLILWLKDHGLNKRVRNIAKQMSNNKKYKNA